MAIPTRIKDAAFLMLVMVVSMIMSSSCQAQLMSTFYDRTCPDALGTIRTVIGKAVSKEHRMAASLIRLHFHDCFVQGCDASILLISGGERTAQPNNNSVRGFEVIDDAKAQVEKICPGVVSCADIVAVAARDASVAVGGPSWSVKLGRRDSTTGNATQAVANLPFFTDGLDILISRFHKKGLNIRDMVALSGAHTIGQAHCFTYRDRLYSNGTDIDASFASARRRMCPASGGNMNLAPLDPVTPSSFDNYYFKNLMQKKGLLVTDQALYSSGPTDRIVLEYSKNSTTFRSDFAAAMIKMGYIEPLTGSRGQIRKICSVVN
ncbi:lignin-forming anionic peroxidase-like [Punica granatum]|uniref:Lignin-forming anionic peroxidase-like n=2 Tax=Punica granatum TaxID=22663 RepID=A0A6P8DGZ8_PUNGR|nr:lignin-forming anionic peroxidase-like [Punica granatum]PKI46019.1 hypothetical protein CRG98_033659 [Punica granatum]